MRRLRKPDPRDGWYEITPADAQQALDKRVKNRPLREFRAQKIAAEIQAKRYRENGESIILTDTGRVLDGQHRLRGVVLANRPIVSYCVFGVPESCFPSLDQGLSRNGTDLASLMGFANASAVAALARLAIRFSDGTIATTGPATAIPTQTLKPYYERNGERLTASVTLALKHREGLKHVLPISHAAFVHYMLSPAHSERAAEFIESIATGVGLAKGDARLLFRARMLDLVGEKHKLTQEHKIALLIKAWNAHYLHEKLGVLRFRPDEPFPRFAD